MKADGIRIVVSTKIFPLFIKKKKSKNLFSGKKF